MAATADSDQARDVKLVCPIGPALRRTVPQWEDGLHTLLRNDDVIAQARGRIQVTITGLHLGADVYDGLEELVVTANPRELPA